MLFVLETGFISGISLLIQSLRYQTTIYLTYKFDLAQVAETKQLWYNLEQDWMDNNGKGGMITHSNYKQFAQNLRGDK